MSKTLKIFNFALHMVTEVMSNPTFRMVPHLMMLFLWFYLVVKG